MIKWASKYFAGIPPVFIDGTLYALIALFMFAQGYLSTEDAKLYVSGAVRFWMLGGIGAAGAFVGAIKMFRSTSYSDHQDQKKSDTQIFRAEANRDIPTP